MKLSNKATLSLRSLSKCSFTSSKLASDLPTSNIYLIIKLLLIYITIEAQFYNIQFAYKIRDFGKIVILKCHLKNFYRGRRLFIFSFASDIAKV